MKITLLILLVLSTNTRAQDAVGCAKKAVDRALFIKTNSFVTQKISDVSEALNVNLDRPQGYSPYKDPSITADKVCFDRDSSFYDEALKSKKIILKRLKAGITPKGIVPKQYIGAINAFGEKDMTQKEFCDSINNVLGESPNSSKSNCDQAEIDFQKKGDSMNLLSKSYKEACLAMFQIVKEHKSKEGCYETNEPKVVQKLDTKKEVKITPYKTAPAQQPPKNQGSFKYLRPGATAQ